MRLFLLLICTSILCCSFSSAHYDYLPPAKLAGKTSPLFNGSVVDSTMVKLISKIEDEYFFIRLKSSAAILAKLEVADNGVIANKIKVIFASERDNIFNQKKISFSKRIPWDQIQEIYVTSRYKY